MARKILILGASYGSLLGTKLLMSGHDVTLVCRPRTAALINAEGTTVRLRLRGEDADRAFRSAALPGALDARAPAEVDPAAYDLVVLAMSEPQYGDAEIARLMAAIARAELPCLSLMNMPPPAYLERIPGLDVGPLRPAFNAFDSWNGFRPGLVSLCSPDPQAFRPPEEGANVLQVGLPTNFKAAAFDDPAHTALLHELEAAIDAVRVDGKEVPVKLRVHESLFVPFAKWAMLMTGNYRCILPEGVQSIREAVHGDLDRSRATYAAVAGIVRRLGADADAEVPFDKYAQAAKGLGKPSSAARAIVSGARQIERVDLLVQLIARQMGLASDDIDAVVETVTRRLDGNRSEGSRNAEASRSESRMAAT